MTLLLPLSSHQQDGVLTQVHTYPVPLGPHDFEAQRDWEHFQVERGIERYRASLVKVKEDGSTATKSLAELEPGQLIAQDLIGPMIEAVKKRQEEIVAGELSGRGPMAEEAWALLALPADTLAACTVLHALTKIEPSPFTSTAIALGTRVQHEWELENWKAAEKKAEQERKAAGGPYVPNLFKLMKRRNEDVDERVFRKWTKKAPLFCKGDWTADTRVRIGASLLGMLVESNAWFEVVTQQQGVRETKMFRMTDVGLAFVADRHAQNELMRPYMLPMICEPLDYEYR